MKYFLILFSVFTSCSKEQFNQQLIKPIGCDSIAFTFEKNIKPIFTSNCNFIECHTTSGIGSFDFTQYAVVADRIKAGTMEYRLELPIDDPQHMPDDMRLSPCDFYKIKMWIRQGYPEK